MKTPQSVAELTALGRVRLSEHFFMREMLYSEVGNHHGMPNVPEDPDLAIEAGTKLCERVLEPLHRAFGGIVVRSAYRSPTLNDFCCRRGKETGDNAYYCSDNTYGAARHIWDLRDADGHMGATASVIVPWYLNRFEKTGDFAPLGWWIRDHVEHYAEALFYPWLCAFNIRWYEGPTDQMICRDAPGLAEEEVLTRRGMANFDGDHSDQYPGFPTLG